MWLGWFGVRLRKHARNYRMTMHQGTGETLWFGPRLTSP
jgi:hypothetical protein